MCLRSTVVVVSVAVLSVVSACTGTMDGAATPATGGNPNLSGQAKAGAAAGKARGCGGCHTSSAGELAGSANGKGMAANLTPDEATGLGGWADDDIVAAIRDGVDDEQNTLCSSMPRSHDLAAQEAADIVAYLRSLPAVSNAVTRGTCTVSAQDAAHHGSLVVAEQHCAACHGADFGGDDGASGGDVFASNITPDKETGIGTWSKQQVVAAIVNGTGERGGSLCSQMPRFANLTEDEASGVAAFLATVPAVKRAQPASKCMGETSNPKVDGETYVNNRRCNGCHAKNLGGKASCQPGDASNLTPTNLAGWSDQQIIDAMRVGTDDEGTMLSSKMPRFPTMGDEEAKAIVAYLRSVPAVVRPGCVADGADPIDAGSSVSVDAGASHVDAGMVLNDAGVSTADAGAGSLDAGHDAGASMPDGGSAPCSGGPVVLSQVYGGGGNVGALYDTDFVELHNRTNAQVSLSGWALQYSSAAGDSWKSQLATFPPNTKINAGAYLLISVGPKGTTGVSLPSTAVVLSKRFDMSATNGKVALTRDAVALSGACPSSAAIVDFLGYGTASCGEGDSTAAPMSSTLAALRKNESGAEMACVDTQVNASDFVKLAPAPHGSVSNVCSCQGHTN